MRNNYFYEFGIIIIIGLVLGLVAAGIIEAVSSKNSSQKRTTSSSTVTLSQPSPTVTEAPTTTSAPTETTIPTNIPSIAPTSLPHFQINNPGGGDD